MVKQFIMVIVTAVVASATTVLMLREESRPQARAEPRPASVQEASEVSAPALPSSMAPVRAHALAEQRVEAQSAEMHPRQERQRARQGRPAFDGEPIDAAWQPEASRQVRAFLARTLPDARVLALECRSRACRLDFSTTEAELPLEILDIAQRELGAKGGSTESLDIPGHAPATAAFRLQLVLRDLDPA